MEQTVALLTEKSCDNTKYCAYQNSCNDGADTNAAGTVNSDKACDNGNKYHGAVKADFNLGKFHSRNLGYSLHGTFTCQRHQIWRQIEENSYSNENGTDEHHDDSNHDIFRRRQ